MRLTNISVTYAADDAGTKNPTTGSGPSMRTFEFLASMI